MEQSSSTKMHVVVHYNLPVFIQGYIYTLKMVLHYCCFDFLGPPNIAMQTVRAIDSFVYMISSNVIGLDKTKTNIFGREGLGLFLFSCCLMPGGHILILFWRRGTV